MSMGIPSLCRPYDSIKLLVLRQTSHGHCTVWDDDEYMMEAVALAEQAELDDDDLLMAWMPLP